MGRLFGTDGIRGVVNEFPMTCETAMLVGQAVVHLLGKKVLIGKDTRRSGAAIETALAAGVCAMGGDAAFLGVIATPGIAFLTRSLGADAGIMVSASHNPARYNGIKIFASDGYKIGEALEDRIEGLVTSREVARYLAPSDRIGTVFEVSNARDSYVSSLKTSLGAGLDLMGTRIALDCAHGVGYRLARRVFEELGVEVILSGASPDGLNINEGCGAVHPRGVCELTLLHRADLGVALDGDGDRCILADETGEIVDGDHILGICAMAMARERRLPGNAIVVTHMSNMGLEASLNAAGIEVRRVSVGDRNVVERMRADGLVLGGEQSGHIIFLDHASTGDGVLASLKVLEIISRTGSSLSELRKSVRLFPQVREDVRVRRKLPFEGLDDVRATIQGTEKLLRNRGRVLVRYSGTEPVARVMVEGEDLLEIRELSRGIASSIQRSLGQA